MSTRSSLAAAFLLALACASADMLHDRVSLEGYRGVRFGMNVAQASAAYGAPLEPGTPLTEDERACHYVSPPGKDVPVQFMVVDDRIGRIDVYSPGILTPEGVGVGSLETEVLSVYAGRATVSPHKYSGPKGHYVTVEQGPLALIFETDGTRVVQYRAGRLPEVAFVEGCS